MHLILLIASICCILALWLLPVFLAGFPFVFPALARSVRDFLQTGLITPDTLRLPTLLVAPIAHILTWENTTAWVVLNASVFAAGLLIWWVTVEKLFSYRFAWISTIIMALMPMYWVEALAVGGYAFSFFFLFLGFACFVYTQERSRILAIILFGICFGATLACRDAFLTFIPWLVVAYAYLYRSQRLQTALHIALFLCVTYASFALPLLPNALQEDLSPRERITVFLPTASARVPGSGHLYPDDYIFEYHREAYDTVIAQRVEDSSFLKRQEDQHYRYIFGIGDFSLFDGLLNGFWLTVHTFPQLLIQEYIGGAFLWLFILPGIAWFYRERRKLLFLMAGLWISMELILRFVLHFGRSHLMDIGFIFALLAAAGVATIAEGLPQKIRKVSVWKCTVLITIIISLQLLQANRKLLAHKYSRSTVPEIYAVSAVLRDLPEDVFIVHPRRNDLFHMVHRPNRTLNTPSIDFLEEHGLLIEPFERYGVTHILGYDPEYIARLQQVAPRVHVLEIPEDVPNISYSPLIRYLLHLVR